MRPSGHVNLRFRARRAFTLIEMIFVLVILAVGAALVAPHMGAFFRGRVLTSEAKRLMSLVHLGQSRAVAEGVPVLLWVDPRTSTYGLRVQSSYGDTDGHAATFATDSTVTLDVPPPDAALVSEQDDEKLGITDGLIFIRFLPDGFYDEMSVRKIVLRQGTGDALEIGQTTNRLTYEIRPLTPN